MKKHFRVVSVMAVCIAGFIGQLSASGASTNSVWDLTSISVFKVAKITKDLTNSASALFFSDGTCALQVGTNSFTGNYTVAKKGKSITLTPDTGGEAAIGNYIDSAIESYDSSVTATAKSGKFSKITLSKTGLPLKATDTVSGKITYTNGKGKLVSKSFSVNTLWTDWTWSSGTSTNF
ncbi:MAG: hypothetical protein ABSD58_19580 [Verrucomicrobiia bacterium]